MENSFEALLYGIGTKNTTSGIVMSNVDGKMFLKNSYISSMVKNMNDYWWLNADRLSQSTQLSTESTRNWQEWQKWIYEA